MLNSDTTLNSALAEAVQRWPGRVFLKMDGLDVTFAEFDEQVGQLAAGLRSIGGVTQGDRVCVFMRNSLACEHTWFAANRLGAAWVPVNTEFRGLLLDHALQLADARVYIVDSELKDLLLDALNRTGIDATVVVHGDFAGAAIDLADLYLSDGVPPVEVSFAETSALLYTSGTTGRSKACMLSHRYFVSQAQILIREFGITGDDVLYCPFPLFHADATALTTVPALLLGATAAISKRFSASRFWTEIRETKATVFDFMGATLSILDKADPHPDDLNNTVRLAWGVPVPESVESFERRFGLQVVELYGSVEANIPITQPRSEPRVPGSCGRVIDEFEIVVADEFDQEVSTGETGELLIRPKTPWTTFSGYHGNPEASTEALRNMWFHTGDLVRVDENGNVFFVGRKKEAIRRRGENISAFEVEEAVREHPAVLDCAAYGVRSELTEEEVKISVVQKPGSTATEAELWEFCYSTMARFQVPRYIEFVSDLPKTPTGKVEKFRLQESPFNETTREFELPAKSQTV